MTNIYLIVMRIVTLIVGIMLCITIIGAILGVPLIIASGKFRDASLMSDSELVAHRGSLLGWAIFSAIVLCPTILGMIAILVFAALTDTYIKNIEQGNPEKNDKTVKEFVVEGTANTVNEVKDAMKPKSNLEKQIEEIKKLKSMKEEGLITEEEYEALRRKTLGL